VTRSLLTSLTLIALLSSVAATPGWAQGAGDGQRPPTELWDEFPLKQPPPGSQEQGGRPAAPAPASERQGEDDGSPGTPAVLLAGLAALAVLGAGMLLGVGVRRRRRSRAAAAARPPLTLPAGSVRRADSADLPADGRTASPQPVTMAAASKREPAPAAKAPGEPEAPPAPAHREPAAERAAPDRAGKPPATPSPAPAGAAAPQDGRGAPDARVPPPRPSVASQRAVGYASVSAADDLNNAELKVQVRLIQEACQRRGLTLVKVVRDVESHASSDLRRPGLTYALDRLAARDASCLVVSSLERLTRTAANLGALLGWLRECDARLVVIDLDLDTGTHEGQLGARALATVGGLERRKLEERTRKGLEAARHMRRSGRPAVSDRPPLKARIADMRAQGMTLQAIADTLNAEGVPTLRGGAEWRPSSVQAAAGYKRPRRKGVLQAPAPPRDKSA
jgi:DNA invertase Pin-like site-specific DNA recombinase